MLYKGYKNNNIFSYFILVTILVTTLSSCVVLDNVPDKMLPDKYSRLLVYLHLENSSPLDISFTLNSIQIKNLSSGQWEVVTSDEKKIVSSELVGNQLKLAEAIISPASYGKIKLDIKSVRIKDVNGKETLLMPDGESFYFDLGVSFKNEESHLLQLAWSPERSLRVSETDNTFNPAISILTEKPVADGLGVFVSNSGSNYLSIIDKDLERVVGATTVGHAPMGMVLNIEGDRLYVVNRKSATVTVIDVGSQDIFETIDISSYSIEPFEVVFLPNDGLDVEGKLYVLNKHSNDVIVIDTNSSKVIKTIPVGLSPSGMVLDKQRKEIYVSNEGSDSVTLISGMSDTVSTTIEVGHSALGVALGDDKVYVFCGEAGGIKVLSPSTRTITEEISTAIAPSRGLVAFDRNFYVTNEDSSEVSLFDEFGVFVQTIDVGSNPIGVAGDSVKERIYVTNAADGSVSIVDPINKITKVFLPVGEKPYTVVVPER